MDGVDFNPLFIHAFRDTGVDSGVGEDMNCDGAVDGADLNPLFIDQFREVGAPGPSCCGSLP